MSQPDEQIFIDVQGDEIVLKKVVLDTILQKHPEVADFISYLSRVLLTPDEIRRSVNDERVVLYYHYSNEILDGKWIVVVVKRIDRNFISTIYATDKIKSGDVIWKK